MPSPKKGSGKAGKPGLLNSARKVAKAAARIVRSRIAPAGAKATAKSSKSTAKAKPPAKAAVAKAAEKVKAKVKAPAKPAAKPAAKAAPKTAKPATKAVAAKAAKVVEKVAEKVSARAPAKAAAKAPAKAAAKAPAKAGRAPKFKSVEPDVSAAQQTVAPPPASRPRASKLPPPGNPLNKREMEQLLTAGQGRGVTGEGSLKGRLVVKDGFPYLHVIGRDKRELVFLLQGPDQEVLPAYADHKVSVSGLIKKTNNYSGTVDVRKWSAKKPETDQAPAEEPDQKLRFLSPGEVEMVCTGGMGAGLTGFAKFRGNLELTGEDFFLVVSGAGTRQQVSFVLQGKATKGLRKHVGHTIQVLGVVEKSSGWGGTVQLENWEPRASEARGVQRQSMPVTHVEGLSGDGKVVDAVLNGGLTVRLTERAGYTWAVEPTTAKRLSLREANFEPSSSGPATREFFFTPRNPGTFEVEFFLAKAFNPAQVAKSCKLTVNVKSQA